MWFGRLWEHQPQHHGGSDLLRVLRSVWRPAQRGGAQQGGQVHAGYREEHLRFPAGEDRPKGEDTNVCFTFRSLAYGANMTSTNVSSTATVLLFMLNVTKKMTQVSEMLEFGPLNILS